MKTRLATTQHTRTATINLQSRFYHSLSDDQKALLNDPKRLVKTFTPEQSEWWASAIRHDLKFATSHGVGRVAHHYPSTTGAPLHVVEAPKEGGKAPRKAPRKAKKPLKKAVAKPVAKSVAASSPAPVGPKTLTAPAS